MERIENFLINHDAGLILDVATGQGNFIPFLLGFKSVEKIIAVDVIEQLKPFFEKHYADKPVEYQLADAYNLPFDSESFDTVSVSNSLHHFEDTQKVLQEMLRVLKPGGMIIINEMYSDNLNAAQESHKLLHHWSAEQDRTLGRFHDDTYTKAKLLKIIDTAGIKEVSIFDYSISGDDFFNKDTLDHVFSSLEILAKRMSDNPDTAHLSERYNEIRSYISENGYASASSIFYAGTKV